MTQSIDKVAQDLLVTLTAQMRVLQAAVANMEHKDNAVVHAGDSVDVTVKKLVAALPPLK